MTSEPVNDYVVPKSNVSIGFCGASILFRHRLDDNKHEIVAGAGAGNLFDETPKPSKVYFGFRRILNHSAGYGRNLFVESRVVFQKNNNHLNIAMGSQACDFDLFTVSPYIGVKVDSTRTTTPFYGLGFKINF